MEKTKEVKKQGNFAEKHPKLNLLLGLALIIADGSNNSVTS